MLDSSSLSATLAKLGLSALGSTNFRTKESMKSNFFGNECIDSKCIRACVYN